MLSSIPCDSLDVPVGGAVDLRSAQDARHLLSSKIMHSLEAARRLTVGAVATMFSIDVDFLPVVSVESIFH